MSVKSAPLARRLSDLAGKRFFEPVVAVLLMSIQPLAAQTVTHVPAGANLGVTVPIPVNAGDTWILDGSGVFLTRVIALPSGSPGLTVNGQGNTLTLNDGAGSFGGFDISAGTTLNLADITLSGGYSPIATNHAVTLNLSGQVAISQTNLFYQGFQRAVLSVNGDLSLNNNTYGVFLITQSGNLTINGNLKTAGNSTTDSGSAIYAIQTSTVTINGDLTANGNTASRSGGVISTQQDTPVTIKGSLTASDNTAGSSGGALSVSGAVTVTGATTMSGNAALGGPLGSNGGAIAAAGNVNLAVTSGNIALSDNTAATDGGGIADSGTTANVTLGNAGGTVSITGNRAGFDRSGTPLNATSVGGGIYSGESTTITGSSVKLSNNTATGDGGAIYATTDFTLNANAMVSIGGNTAGGHGGAIWAGGNVALNAIGGDITFSGNQQASGANGIYLDNTGGDATMTLNATTGHTISFFDPIMGNATNGPVTMLKTGAGTVEFDGSSYSMISDQRSQIDAATEVRAGTFVLSNHAVYGTALSSFAVDPGATLAIGSVPGGGAVAPGTLAVPTVILASQGALVLNHTDTSGSYLFTPQISGDGAVTQVAGLTTLMSTNTYTGATTVNGGTLLTGITNTFASSSDVVVNGGALDLDGHNQLAHRLAGSRGAIALNGATLTAENASTADNTVFAGAIADGATAGGSLIKTGSGSLTLTGNSTYAGPTTISAGTLQIGNGGASGTVLSDIANQSALIFNRSDDSTYGGALSGAGSMSKQGAGTLSLAGTGSSQGRVEVQQGTLQFMQTGPFATTGAFTTQSGGTTNIGQLDSTLRIGGVLTQAVGATLDVTLGASPDIMAQSAVLDGNLTISGFSDGPTPVKARDVINGQRYTMLHTTGGISGNFVSNPLQPSGLDYLLHEGFTSANGLDYNLGFELAWTEGGAAEGTGSFTMAPNTAFDVDVALADQVIPTGGFASGWDGRSLTKNGEGLLVLSAANPYMGATTVNGGTLQTRISNAFASSSDVVINGGTLDLQGHDQRAHRLAGNGGAIQLNGATLTADNAASTDNTVFAGAIGDGGTAGGSLIKIGDGALILAGSLGYTGSTTVGGGTLALSGGADLSVSAATTLARAGSMLAIGGVSGTGAGVQNLSGVSGSQLLLSGKTLTVTNSQDTIFAGNIDISDASIVKNGSGSLMLSGEVGYTGPTQLDGGRLILDGSAGGARLTSDVVGQSGSALALIRGASLTGMIDPADVAIDSASTWNVTANSIVDTLTLAGQANLVAPVSTAAIGRTLTVSNLVGQGGTIGLYTILGDDTSRTDQVILNGGTVSGNTYLRVQNQGGTGAQTAVGIPLVVATNGATTSTDAFALSPQSNGYRATAQTLAAGAYEYSLVRGGSGRQADSWYLTSQSDVPAQPLVRPEAGVYLANDQVTRLMFMMTLRDREGAAQPDGGAGASGVWGRVVGGSENGQAAAGALTTSANTAEVQLGADLWRGNLIGQGTTYAGVMGSWGHLWTEAVSRQTTPNGKPGGTSSGSVDGYAAGVYGTWYQNDRGQGGAYVDSWAQYQWSTHKVNGSGLPEERYDADGFTVSVETGYGFLLRQNSATKLYLEPQLQMAYVDYSADDHTEAGGTQVRYGQGSGMVARVGARLSADYTLDKQGTFRPYVEANYWYNQRTGELTLNNDLVPGGAPRSFGELKVGAIGNLGRRWLLSGDLGIQASERRYNAITGKISLKYAW